MAKKKSTKSALTKKKASPPDRTNLLGDIRSLIEAAREQTARAVNSTLVIMYLQIGKRIREDVLQNERAEYGKEIVATLSRQLTAEYGRGFGRRNLEQMLCFAEVFPNEQIAQTLSAQLSCRVLLFTSNGQHGDSLAGASGLYGFREEAISSSIIQLLFDNNVKCDTIVK